MYTMSWSAAALVAPLMSGFVIDRYGAEWLWGMCAVIGTATGAGYGALMRRLPAEEPVVEAPVTAKPEVSAAQQELGGSLK
jgi:MFS family permease